MAGDQIPINPEMLVWARSRAGYTIEVMAQQARFKKVQLWEDPDNEIYPTYKQLEDLADYLKVPVAVFFFPSPPDVPSISNSFRTISLRNFESIEPRIRLLLRKAKALQIGVSELSNGSNLADKLITKDLVFASTAKAESMATKVRTYLGVKIEDQIDWVDAEAAFKAWRSKFFEVGVNVFKDGFRADSYAGFCLYDDEFPLIYVNNSAPFVRQIFTLFHELGHLLLKTSGIDTYSYDNTGALTADGKRVEVLCNKFANAFLVPNDKLNDLLSSRDVNEESAREIAAQFHVSWLVVYKRFFDRKLISRDEYKSAVDSQTARRELPARPGGNYYNNQMAYLGRPYVGMALSAFYQQRINERQLADYLNIAPKSIGGIEAKYLEGRST